VAGSFLIEKDRLHSQRDALLCLVAGAGVGVVIAGYNYKVYGAVTEPFTPNRGYFSIAFWLPHVLFYASALMIIWPAMLLAPLFDRSRLRWLVRGLVVVFLGPLLFYYFHDTTEHWLETLVVGQRLLQVALPLWVVSYACVVDEWVAVPLRRAFGDQAWSVLATVSCAGLLAANAVAFARHQTHLHALQMARDAIAAHVPSGALIIYQGAVSKLVGAPLETPAYHLRALEYQQQPAEDPAVLFGDLEHAPRPWFFALLRRGESDALSEYARSLITHFGLEAVPLGTPLAALYVARAKP
jgi:hypothetical protein